MRKWLLTAWCMIPVGATAFHFGPGQDHAALDRVAELMAEGQAFAKEGRALQEKDQTLAAAGAFAKADNAFSQALSPGGGFSQRKRAPPLQCAGQRHDLDRGQERPRKAHPARIRPAGLRLRGDDHGLPAAVTALFRDALATRAPGAGAETSTRDPIRRAEAPAMGRHLQSPVHRGGGRPSRGNG